MKEKQYYEVVSVEDELPEVGQPDLIIMATDVLSNVCDTQLREATYQSNE